MNTRCNVLINKNGGCQLFEENTIELGVQKPDLVPDLQASLLENFWLLAQLLLEP